MSSRAPLNWYSGAIKKCMIQVHDYIESGDPALEYFRQSTATSNKYYGFGHRIHKTNEADPIEMLGKDPRVDLYLAATRHGFPEQSELIDRLLGYAAHIRSKRRSLGANTDFGAAVLFSAIGLSPDAAESFFCAFRCVGLCADIVNELRVKGNSRRPPFPETLAFW